MNSTTAINGSADGVSEGPGDLISLRSMESEMEDIRRIVCAASAILRQGEELLQTISAPCFTRRLPMVFNASIGGHYRHCLDHFDRLLKGMEMGEVDYDHRDRDRRIENDPRFALESTRGLRRQLEGLEPGRLLLLVRVRCEVSYADGDSPLTRATLSRELVYAIAHAIHHFALISVMAHMMGVSLPQHFGIAPSTVAHQNGNPPAA
ncbi:MAG TPA: hypothetical protein VK968_19650 [Roseimicrobium sp.]|nr:hypothetical protein [Roseimicrobium sp.]